MIVINHFYQDQAKADLKRSENTGMYVRDEVHLFVNRYSSLILLLHPNFNARKRIHTLQKDKQGSFFINLSVLIKLIS